MITESNKFGERNIVSHNGNDTFIGPPEFDDTPLTTQSGKFDWGGLFNNIINEGFDFLNNYVDRNNPQQTYVRTPVNAQDDNTGLFVGIGAGLLLLIILLLVIKK